jgi:amidohydrolase
MTAINFKLEADALRDELVARRRDLHQHPEIAFEEVRTAGIVAAELNKLGLEVQTGVGKTGVVGILDGEQAGPTVLVRADMDALPVHEENETDYISQTAGKMHACGHDGHTTIGLGVAKFFAQRREQMAGRIKFVFQPAEEIAGGAKAMIADGVLENPRPDVSLGLHLWNYLPVGKLGVATGPVMAGSDSFEVVITGKGGHGAMPHMAQDPVVCAAQVVTAWQTIISRNLSPVEGGVLSVTRLDAGHASNVIPQTVTLRGTTRYFKQPVRQMMRQRMTDIASHIAAAMGCELTSVDWNDGTKPVSNHPEVSQRVREAFLTVVGEDAFVLDERAMVAEDMAFLMDDIPGFFFFVGSADAAAGKDYGHHHPRFDFDEAALPLSVALLAKAAAAYVMPEAT